MLLRWASLGLLAMLFVSGILSLVSRNPSGGNAQKLAESTQSSEGAADNSSSDYVLSVNDEALQAAAENGDPEAQYRLAQTLRRESESSDNVAVLDMSIRWLMAAATNGHPQAQVELGALYMAGRGVLQDFTRAAQWFEMSARQGVPEAMYQLGRMIRSGWGVEESAVEAYIWLNLASARGEIRAGIARDQVMKLLAADTLRDAQKRSRVLDESIPRAGVAGSAQALR